jgi:uncharacterized protein YndB with AHSA1/START domain
VKWILIAAPIIVALVAAFLTILVIGYLLPRHHKATRSARVAVSPEQVWGAISDFAARPQWVPHLQSVERLPDRNGHAVWKDNRDDGWGMPVEVEVFEPPRRMVTRIADDKLPVGGTWSWEVTPDAGGARLRITEDGEIKVAPFRYFAAMGDMSSTMREVLTALGKRFNQDVVIEP